MQNQTLDSKDVSCLCVLLGSARLHSCHSVVLAVFIFPPGFSVYIPLADPPLVAGSSLYCQ